MSPAPKLWSLPFAVAGVLNLCHGLAIMLSLHLPGWLEARHTNEVVIGLVMGSMSGAAVLVRPAAGGALDGRLGRRGVLFLGGLANVGASIGYLFADDVGALLVVVRVVHGFAQGALFSGIMTVAADLVPAARRTEGLMIFGIFGMLPIALAGLIGDLVLRLSDYPTLFMVQVGFASVATLLTLGLPETRAVFAGTGPAPARAGVLGALAQPSLRPLWLASFSFSIALGAIFTFMKSWVLEEQVGQMSHFFGAYAGVAILLRAAFGWVPTRFGEKRALVPAIMAFSVALLVLAFGTSIVAVVAAGAIAGFGHGYAFPILSAITAVRAREGERGAALSAFTAVVDAGVLIAGPLCGLLASATSLRTMFAIVATLPVAGALVYVVWDARVMSEAQEPSPAPEAA